MQRTGASGMAQTRKVRPFDSCYLLRCQIQTDRQCIHALTQTHTHTYPHTHTGINGVSLGTNVVNEATRAMTAAMTQVAPSIMTWQQIAAYLASHGLNR